MAISNVWVLRPGRRRRATTATLELLTKARELGSTSPRSSSARPTSFAAALGEYGATKVYATGDLGGKLPGVAGAAAMKAVIDGGDSPDLILFPQNYEGRDVVGPPVGQARQAGADEQRRPRRAGRRRARDHAGLRRHQARDDHVHRRRSVPRGVPPEELRRRGVGRRCPRGRRRAGARPRRRRRGRRPGRPRRGALRARSSTRRPSSSRAVAASARRRSTR